MSQTLAKFQQYASIFSIRKIWNAFRLLLSWQLSRMTDKAIHWGHPMTLSVEPTTACNLRCPECPSGLRSFTRPTGNLTEELFRKLIDQTHQHLFFLIFYFQGEPFIHPFFLEMVSYARKKGIYTITSTNGHFLSMENCRKTITAGLNKLIISVDGTTQEAYANYRKEGKLDVVLQGARNMVQCKKEMGSATPRIVFQFLVVRHNEHQIPEIKQLAREIGVDEVSLKTAQIYHFESGSPLIPENPVYSRYKQTSEGSWAIKNPMENKCWKLWHASVVTWDGRVVPCCFDKDARYQMGQIKEESFASIWRGTPYDQFRKKLVAGRKEIDICQNCTEGTLTGD